MKIRNAQNSGGRLACLSSPEPVVHISSQLQVQRHHVGINHGRNTNEVFSPPHAASCPTFTSLPLPAGHDLQGDISWSPEFTNGEGGHRRLQKLPEWLSCYLVLSYGSGVHTELSPSWNYRRHRQPPARLCWGHRKTREGKTRSHNVPPRYGCQMKYRMPSSR